MTDDRNPGDEVDPREFETFDKFDENLSPPELPDGVGDTAEFTGGVPAATVMSAVGVLSVAYNRR